MKLDKLLTLNVEILKEVATDGVNCEIHYQIGKKWYNLETRGIAPASITSNLEKSKRESIAYHSPNSLTAHFHLSHSNATVSLTFSKSPQILTRKKFREKLTKTQESASNAYQVSHHHLTELLAKNAFRERLKKSISEITQSQTSDIETLREQPKTLAVLALDIDYFKQINDTWGHLYGDQVLKTFGKRLESAAESIKDANTNEISIDLGHPSGEEFLVSITAHATRDQFATWANRFRSVISEEILPTENEWDWLCKSDNLKALTPPPIPDRKLSTSIGVVLYAGTLALDPITDLTSNLLDRADTALYRAKAAGRNQVIFYDDILSSCGRVLEQEQNTRIIAIDIGSTVGVNIGQEFNIYHPSFTGLRKFSINDGRTTKTLGTYPRIATARIVVFNTQPEISFAVIDPPDDITTDIEVGSHLEAIPAGSISHLLPSTSRYFPTISEQLGGGGIQILQGFIDSSLKTNQKPFALVIKLSREQEHLRKHGTASINSALAKIYRTAQRKFQSSRAIEVLDRDSICIVGANDIYREKTTLDFMTEISSDLPDLGLLAGVFCHTDVQEIKKIHNLELNAKNSIEFARLASSEHGRDPAKLIRHFTPESAASALSALRSSSLYETGYADFERLLSLGVKTGRIYNLGGLLAGSLDRDEDSLDHYGSAIKCNPEIITFKTNYGIAAYNLGDYETGLAILNKLSIEDMQKTKESNPYGYFIYAFLLAIAKIKKSSLFDEKKFNAIGPDAVTLKIPHLDPKEVKKIRDALYP